MNAITVKHLNKIFIDEVAVNDVSFEVPFGQITALLGPNGAGKSTALNMIAGILIPTSGQIEIAGLGYRQHYRQIKAKMGHLTSDMSLYESFSLLENLQLIGNLRNYSGKRYKQRLEQLCHMFELGPILEKRFDELSSGQKQRALIAASIFHDPDILIFDEVTASLDVIMSKDIMDFLKSEKERGKAILFSTHILSEVEYISDRILFIEKGHIIKETTYRTLMQENGGNNITEAFYNQLKKNKAA